MITQVSVFPQAIEGANWYESEWYEESIGTKVITRRAYNYYVRVINGVRKRYKWLVSYETYSRC
jgi:hypothetical protein